MIIGYARTSTTEQNIEPQVDALRAAGCERIYQEQRSGVDAARPVLHEMLDNLRKGDVVVVTKLDRIGRSTKHLLEIIDALKKQEVEFKALNNADIDTTTATGKMLLTILAAVATFEREIMLERQREGIAAAKAAGKYKGRKPTAKAKGDQIRELASQGMKREEIAAKVEVGIASVYRALKNNPVSSETN